MRRIYLDTAFFVALLDRADAWHLQARRIVADLRGEGAELVTSNIVFIELMTYFSNWGTEARHAVATYTREVTSDPLVTVVDLDADLYGKALDLYERRPDKTYSAVDCIGMVICSERGITDVLTADHDFEQEGLTILLK